MQNLKDIESKLGSLEDVGLKTQTERIQLAIAEQLEGIRKAVKALASPEHVQGCPECEILVTLDNT